MSPTIGNRFKGHLAHGDPRGPLTAAGGCIWPTVPAFRYWLKSDDASGELTFLNHNPIRIQYDAELSGHNVAIWKRLGFHYSIFTAVATKIHVPGTSIYTWWFSIRTVLRPFTPIAFQVERDIETCNRDIPLPNVPPYYPGPGGTGDTFRMEQIEWDQTSPPPV